MSELSATIVRGVWIMVICIAAAIALNAGFTLWAIRNYQQAQKTQGAAIETTLCATLNRLAALKPPPGNPAQNPSRAYLQQEHATLAQLGGDLRCRR